MATDRKGELKLAEAAAKTTAVLETLRSRLSRDAPPRETSAPEAPAIEVPDELGQQLDQYFAGGPLTASPEGLTNVSAEGLVPDEIRAQVIDGVVNRILRSWGSPNGQISTSIRSEVIARLVEHVLAELLRKSAPRGE